MAKDLIKIFCEGEGKGFGGKRCREYVGNECSLLKDRIQIEIFVRGRCRPFEMAKAIVRGRLRGYKDLMNSEEYVDSITNELVHAITIKPYTLKKGAVLPVLKDYIRTSARRKVPEIMRKEGSLPQYPCANCAHLPFAKPRTCQRETFITSQGEIKNPYYGKTMRPPGSSKNKPLRDDEFEAPGRCDGFDKLIKFTSVIEEIHSGSIPRSLEPEIINEMLEPIARILHEQAVGAKNSRKRKEYERQEILFNRLTQWVSETGEEPTEEWKIHHTEEFKVSKKTIERDLKKFEKLYKLHVV